jgi:methyl-accepting chemotaxis protein
MAASDQTFVPLSQTYDEDTLAMIAESEDIILDSKNRVTKIRKKTQEIKEIGGNTLEKLYHQGQQIDRVEEKVDSINDNVKEGERQLTSIESIFGALKNKFIGRSKKSKPSLAKRSSPSIPEVKRQPIVSIRSDPTMFDHLSPAAQKNLHEIDDGLDAISQDLDEIQAMAKEMGREVGKQNQQLPDLSHAVGTTTQRVQKASKRTRRQF